MVRCNELNLSVSNNSDTYHPPVATIFTSLPMDT